MDPNRFAVWMRRILNAGLTPKGMLMSCPSELLESAGVCRFLRGC